MVEQDGLKVRDAVFGVVRPKSLQLSLDDGCHRNIVGDSVLDGPKPTLSELVEVGLNRQLVRVGRWRKHRTVKEKLTLLILKVPTAAPGRQLRNGCNVGLAFVRHGHDKAVGRLFRVMPNVGVVDESAKGNNPLCEKPR